MSEQFITADAIDGLRCLVDDSFDCVVTSPPYWGLRDYNHADQLGLEKTPEEYVENLVAVFNEVRRVLRPAGTLWLNLGDSYNAYNGNAGPGSGFSRGAACDTERPKLSTGHGLRTRGLKPKDLVGIPWRVAFALQAAGWWLRSDIIWAKPNPMPESVRDRPTKAHEYVFLLSKSKRYHYDEEAIREPSVGRERFGNWVKGVPCPDRHDNQRQDMTPTEKRNRRSVWSIITKPYKGNHFAVMPDDLAALCVLAGCPADGTVLDPFSGSGTVAVVCRRLGRHFVGIDVNPDCKTMAEERLAGVSLAIPFGGAP